jgi:N-acetylated-alpha-linked acidic dipeptidase
MDRTLIRVERDLLDPAGLAGRPWYRHLVFAPQFTYAPEVLPGVAEASRTGTPEAVDAAIRALAAALRRATATLQKG